MEERMRKVDERLRKIDYVEALGEKRHDHEVNMLLFLDAEYERRRFEKDKEDDTNDRGEFWRESDKPSLLFQTNSSASPKSSAPASTSTNSSSNNKSFPRSHLPECR